MKKKVSSVIMLLLLLATFTACERVVNPGFDPDDYEPILPPEPVYTLSTYANGVHVTLLDDGLSNIVLKWIPSEKLGNMVVRYEVLFDRDGGDFTNPIYVSKSDNSGLADSLTISHNQVNNIARLAGIKSNTNGNLNWRIRVYCGLDDVTSSIIGSFSLTRLDGFDLIPETLYITGAGTEGGSDLTQALQFRDRSTADFEIFTKLTAGQEFSFVSSTKSDSLVNYYYNGTKLVENTGTMTVSQTGIYRLKVNFNDASYTIDEVTDVYYHYEPSNVRETLNYIGKGLWKTDSFYAKMQSVDWASSGEKRYQMRMKLNLGTGSGEVQIIWGHKDSDQQSIPNASTDASYFNLYESPSTDSWAYSFRLPAQLNLPNLSTVGSWATSTVPTVIEAHFNNDFDSYRHVWIYN